MEKKTVRRAYIQTHTHTQIHSNAQTTKNKHRNSINPKRFTSFAYWHGGTFYVQVINVDDGCWHCDSVVHVYNQWWPHTEAILFQHVDDFSGYLCDVCMYVLHVYVTICEKLPFQLPDIRFRVRKRSRCTKSMVCALLRTAVWTDGRLISDIQHAICWASYMRLYAE